MKDRLRAWEAQGRYLDIGRKVFGWEAGEGPPLIALHGFPASSYDWHRLAKLLEHRRLIAFDFPGYGLSDKSAHGDYSLLAQADLAEQVVRHFGVDSCDLIAHDMGDSVAAELLARANDGRLSFEVRRAVLLNGSIFIDLARLTRAQRLLLRVPARPLPFAPPVRVFRRTIRSLFSSEHMPADDEIEMMEALIVHGGGARLSPILIRYIEERRMRQEKWTSGLVDWPGELSLIWGELDPVAGPAMTERLAALRPRTTVVTWSDVGHWPQLEVPDRLAAELERLLP